MNRFVPAVSASDQADGLRRLFANRQSLVPLAANPHVADAAVLLERLSLAFAQRGARTLVIDAADTSPPPHELIDIDLPACIETLGEGLHYLAARGLPLRHANARGSSEGWLAAVEGAMSRVDAVILHAGARDLVRLLGRRTARPVLLASAEAGSLTDAYASMKLLAQRAHLMDFDLLVASNRQPRRAQALAERLAETGEIFLGAAVRGFAALDCRREPPATPDAALQMLVSGQLQQEEVQRPAWSSSAIAHAPARRAAPISC